MDNNRDYIERRNRIYAAGKRWRIKPRKQWNSSLFFLRLNICLGLAVIVIMASYIDTAPTEAFCEGVNKLIGENMSVDDVKNTFEKNVCRTFPREYTCYGKGQRKHGYS